MRYKNIKTGAIIDSSFVISGDNWEVLKHNQKGEAVSGEEEVPEEYIEEEINLDEMTKAELIELAKENKIEVNDRDTKSVIIEAIAKAFE